MGIQSGEGIEVVGFLGIPIIMVRKVALSQNLKIPVFTFDIVGHETDTERV